MVIFLIKSYFYHSYVQKIDMTWWLAVHIIFFAYTNVKCVFNLAPVHFNSEQFYKWIQTPCLHNMIKIIHVPCRSWKWLREPSPAAHVLSKSNGMAMIFNRVSRDKKGRFYSLRWLNSCIKTWGSPCLFKRKLSFISLPSLVWGKSLMFCTRTH